jgi:ankyrin repeat protein
MKSRTNFNTLLDFLQSIAYRCYRWAAPIYHAAKAGDVARVQSLLVADPTLINATKNLGGYTLLMVAAEKGRLEVMKLLLNKGAAIDAATVFGETPLSRAAGAGQFEAVKLLLDNGAVVDSKDCLSSTPLVSAAQNGHYEVVKLLLEKGAKPKGSMMIMILLSIAEKNGHKDIVELLKKEGND